MTRQRCVPSFGAGIRNEAARVRCFRRGLQRLGKAGTVEGLGG